MKAQQLKQRMHGGGVGGEDYDASVSGAPSFSELEVNLRIGQTILSNAGALAYMREGVERGSLKVGGIKGFFGRALAGQSAFQVSYKGLDNKGDRRITFSSSVPGDMLRIELQPGESAVVSRESYVAGSPSITVTGKLNWRGAFSVGQDEGLVLPELVCKETAGSAWLGAFGSFRRHELLANQTLTVDNGLFLAAINKPSGGELYTVVKLGKTLVSSFLGGEGLGMRFRGPCTVYTQSHNLNEFAGQVIARMPSSGGGSKRQTQKRNDLRLSQQRQAAINGRSA